MAGFFRRFSCKTAEEGSNSQGGIPWARLAELVELDALQTASYTRPQLIFKHSSRCALSSMMLRRFEQAWQAAAMVVDFHQVDVIGNREISGAVANRLGIRHESPQAILIIGGEVAAAASHGGIPGMQVPETA